jgi:hypothetical protein
VSYFLFWFRVSIQMRFAVRRPDFSMVERCIGLTLGSSFIEGNENED